MKLKTGVRGLFPVMTPASIRGSSQKIPSNVSVFGAETSRNICPVSYSQMTQILETGNVAQGVVRNLFLRFNRTIVKNGSEI